MHAHISGRLIKTPVLTGIGEVKAGPGVGKRLTLGPWRLQSPEDGKASGAVRGRLQLFLSDHSRALPMGPFLWLSPEFFYLVLGLWHLLEPKLIKKKKKLSAARSDVCINPRTMRTVTKPRRLFLFPETLV